MSLSETLQIVVSHEWLWYAMPMFSAALVGEYLLFLRHHRERFSISDSGASVGLRGYGKVAKRWSAATTLRMRVAAVFGSP